MPPASSPAEYLAALPDDRRVALAAVRDAINENLPEGYAEGMQYGMPAWFVPHELYPAGYHCDPKQPVPFASLASQKNHMALYLFCVYVDTDLQAWFAEAWKATGKKLDMGKGCVRFKNLEDIALDVIGEAVRRVPVEAFLRTYDASRPQSKAKAAASAKAAPKASGTGRAAVAPRSSRGRTGRDPSA